MDDTDVSDALSKAPKETLLEIVREAESYLANQLTAALAADQRALTLAGFLAATIVVLIGAVAGFALVSSPHWPLAGVSLAVAAGFTVALFLAIGSAKPSSFEFSGNAPSEWVVDIENGKDFVVSLAEQCSHYDEMISANNDAMRENARTINLAIKFASWSLVAGGFVFSILIFGPKILALFHGLAADA